MLNFVHLTDCHLLKEKTGALHNINTFENLSLIIEDIKQNDFSYDFLLVTGDISQDSSKESYDLFNSLIKKLNKPVYCLPGNHDDPFLLKKACKASPNQAISVNLIKSHLLILLNSHKDSAESGELSQNQFEQLKNILANNQQRPVIIAVHHHPIKIQSTWMDNINLQNGDKLLALLENFPMVKMVLFGHVHQEIEMDVEQIKFFGSPSTGYQYRPLQDMMQTDHLTAGYRTVKLLDDGSIESKVHRINAIKQIYLN